MLPVGTSPHLRSANGNPLDTVISLCIFILFVCDRRIVLK